MDGQHSQSVQEGVKIEISSQCKIQSASGTVYIIDQNGNRQPVQPGQTLTPGIVVVIESGALTLENPDHSLTTLMSSDQVEISTAETPEQTLETVAGAEADDRLGNAGRDVDQQEQPQTDQQEEVLSSSLHMPFKMHIDGLEVSPDSGAPSLTSAQGQAGTLVVASPGLLALQSEPGQAAALPSEPNQFYSESFSVPAGAAVSAELAATQPAGQATSVSGTYGTATQTGAAGGLTGQTITTPGTSTGPTQITVALTGSSQTTAPQVIPPQAATITGTDSGAVTEDQATRTQGVLTVSDPNAGQDHFVAQTVNNPNGTFTIDAQGHWSFSLNNSAAGVQALAAGETQNNTFTVHSADGTTHQVAVTVTGTNDAPVLQGQSQSVTEDGSQLAGQMTATDIDHGDHLSFSTTGPPVAGFSINKDGSYTFDPTDQAYQHLAAGQTDKVTIPLTVTDAAGATSTENLVITVTGAADGAVISGTPVGMVREDTQITTAGKLDVTDPDAGQAEFVPQTGVSGTYGSFTVQPDGTWNYQLDNSNPKVQALTDTDQLTDTITVSTKDGTTQQITVTVNGTGDQAVISGTDTGTATEDQSLIGGDLIVNGKLNVVDPDSGEATFPLQHGSGSNGYGTFLISPTGGWVYKADNSQAAIQQLGASSSPLTDSFVIHSADGTQHTLTVTIQGTNDAPVLQAQSQSVTEDGSLLSGQMVATDVDTGDTLTYSPPAQQVAGFTLNPDGSYTFDPTDQAYQHLIDGQTQKVTIPVTVTDSQGASSTQNLDITITGTNDAPQVASLTDQVDEDVTGHSLDLLQGATDKEGDALTVSGMQYQVDGKSVSGMPPGVSLAADGHTLQVDTSGQAYQHLSQGQTQEIKVSYLVDDGHGGTTPQTAVLNVIGQDDKATLVSSQIDIGETDAIQSSYHTFQGQLALDDVDSTTTFDSNPPSATFLGQGFEPGSLLVFPDGRYEFSLQTHRLSISPDRAIDALKSGEHMDIPYSVKLSDGQFKNIIVRVHGEDDSASIKVGTYSSFNINEDENRDVTADGKIYTTGFATVTDPDHDEAGVIAQDVTTAKGGHFKIAEDGHWSYTYDKATAQHLAQGESIIERFTVTSIDGSASHEVAVTVLGTNDAPVVSSAVSLAAGTEDTALTLHAADLLANATDVDTTDTLGVQNLKADHGTVSTNPDGSFTFTPDKDYNGQVSFTYDVVDGHGGSTPAQASLNLAAVGDAAVITGTGGHLLEEDNLYYGYTIKTSGQFHVVDPDGPGQSQFPAGLQHHTGSLGGTLQLYSNGNYFYHIENSAVNHLAAGQEAKETFTIHSVDGTPHQVEFVIEGTNDAPFVRGGATLSPGTEDTAVTLHASDLLAQAGDYDDGETNQLSVHNLAAVKPDGTSAGTIADNQDGTFTYTPAANYNGVVTFNYIVQDPQGASASATATMTLGAVGDAAVISGTDTGDVTEDRHLTGANLRADGTLTVTDPDAGEDHFTAQANVQGSGGYGSFSLDANGHWTYTADNSQAAVQGLGASSPPLIDTLTVTSADGTQHTVAVTIHGTNDRPQLMPTTASATEDGQTISGTLPGTDADTGDTLTYRIASAKYGFHLNTDGTWTFDPSHSAYQHLGAGEPMPVQVGVRVIDSSGVSTQSTVTITLTGTNDAPVVNGAVTLPGGTEDQAKVIQPSQLLGQVTDVDTTDSLEVSGTPTADHGTFSKNTDGSFTFHPEPDYNGPLLFTYDVTDSHGGTVQTSASMNLAAVADVPILNVDITDTADNVLNANEAASATITGNIDATSILSSIEISDGTKTITLQSSQVSVDATTGAYSISGVDLSGLSDGTVTVTAHATGSDGTPGSSVDTIVKESTTSLNLQGFDATTDTGRDRNDGITSVRTPHIVGAAEPGATIVVTDQTGTVLGQTVASANGNFSFVSPRLGEGQHNLTFTATDAAGNTATATQDVTIDTSTSVTAQLDVLSDSGTNHTDGITNVGSPTITGTAEPKAHVTITDDQGNLLGRVTADATGSYSIRTPQLSEGQHTLTITSSDIAGNTATATKVVTVDTAAQVHDNSVSMQEGQSGIHGNLVFDDEHGVRVTSGQGEQQGSYGKFVIHGDGSYTYTPDSRVEALAVGEHQQESFTFAVTDKAGNTATETFEVNLTGTNDAPVFTSALHGGLDDADGHPHRTGGTLSMTDVEGDKTTLHLLDAQGHDMMSSQGGMIQGDYGKFGLLPTGRWFYQLKPGMEYQIHEGDHKQDTFTIRVTDEHGTSTDKTFSIDISGTNNVPVFSVPEHILVDKDVFQTLDDVDLSHRQGFVTEDSLTINQHSTTQSVATGDILTIKDEIGETHTFSIDGSDQGKYGTINIDPQTGAWTYKVDNTLAATQALTHEVESHGGTHESDHETFTVRLTDEHGASTTKTITIGVFGTNDAPVVHGVADLGATDQDQSITITQDQLKANVTDIDDGDHVTIDSVSVDPAAGTISKNTDGSFTFTPSAGFTGDNVPLSYTATDGTATTQGQAVIDVHAATKQPPVIDPSQFTSQVQGSSLVGQLGVTDKNPGDTHQWQVVVGGAMLSQTHGQYGTFSIDSQTGEFTYAPDGGGGKVQKSGPMLAPGQTADSFIVSVTDSTGLSHEMEVDVKVQVNAHHVHGQSGHWVAEIHPVGAQLNPIVSHDEALVDETADADTLIASIDSQATDLTEQIHDLQAQGQDTSEAQAQLDELMGNRAILEQALENGRSADGSVQTAGDSDTQGEHHDDDGSVTHQGTLAEGADPGLAGLVGDQEQLDFDAVSQKTGGEGSVTAEATDQASPDTAAETADGDGSTADGTVATDGDGSLDADDHDDSAKNGALDAGDILQSEADQDIDDLLASQPEKKPVPVDEAAADDATEGTDDSGGADADAAEPADAPDGAALDTALVDSGDDHNV